MSLFGHLTSAEFEEFVYDLLSAMDFQDLNWRKGTPLEGGSSDSGRDIEASLVQKDVDSLNRIEKWFIECKHHTKGVSPQALSGAYSWADSNRPDVLLLAISGFLSNPSKDQMETLIKNGPHYRIKLWECKDLDTLSQPYLSLRKKYNLPCVVPFLDQVHNNHLLYALKPQNNSTEYFFECIDRMDSSLRDDAFSGSYLFTIQPQMLESVTGTETVGELLDRDVSYDAFYQLCKSTPLIWNSPRFAQNTVSEALSMLLHLSDILDLPRVKQMWQEYLRVAKHASTNPSASEKAKQDFERIQRKAEEIIPTLDLSKAKYREKYVVFCESFLPDLMREKAFDRVNPFLTDSPERQEFIRLTDEALDDA